ncbi:MAG: hypothetical protein OIN88_13685 [Candidatus Methanoperedens sp.]|nr:hypothetical protein [Candidatus Methanoperedens sp.]
MGKKAFQFTASQITLETCGECRAVPHCRQIKTILNQQRIGFRCPVKPKWR